MDHFKHIVVDRDATVMVCGGVAMGKDLREYFKNIANYEEMLDQGRYCEELWG